METSPAALPSLSDGVVHLRAFAGADAPELVAIWRDPEIRARNRVPEPAEDAAHAWVAGTRERALVRVAWEWAIVDARSGALAGRRALKDIDWTQHRATAACWIAPQYRGRRFAARSLRLAAAHAFAHGIARIHAECEAGNQASQRSVLAAGMRHERILRAGFGPDHGPPVDMHVFGLRPADLARAPALDRQPGW